METFAHAITFLQIGLTFLAILTVVVDRPG